jgi:hypothetical protein
MPPAMPMTTDTSSTAPRRAIHPWTDAGLRGGRRIGPGGNDCRKSSRRSSARTLSTDRRMRHHRRIWLSLHCCSREPHARRE